MNKKLFRLILTVPNADSFIALIIFGLSYSLLLFYTGTLNSGFHLIDDHEIIRIHNDLQVRSLFEVMADWISKDLSIRFRPIYFAHRVLLVSCLGDNFFLLSIYNLALATLTSLFLYLFIKNLKYGSIKAYMFVCMSLIGPQTAIWWRLGPNETIGIFLFSAALYFLTKSYAVLNYQGIYKMLGLIFMLLSSLCKESFLALIPAVLLANFFLYARKSGGISLGRNIIENRYFNAILGAALMVEIYFIFFVVGINRIGYAGGDSSSLESAKLLAALKAYLDKSDFTLLFTVSAVWIIAFLKSFLSTKRLSLENLQKTMAVLAISFIYLLPQLVLYAKSGIFERYLIPGSLIFAFLTVFFLHQTLQLLRNQFHKYAFWLLVQVLFLAYLIPEVSAINKKAIDFTQVGINVNSAISAIVEKSNAGSAIIVAADPVNNFEEGISLGYFLSLSAGRSNSYYQLIVNNKNKANFENELRSSFISVSGFQEVDRLADKSTVDVVFVFQEIENVFLAKSDWFKPGNYDRKRFGKFSVYLRR